MNYKGIVHLKELSFVTMKFCKNKQTTNQFSERLQFKSETISKTN